MNMTLNSNDINNNGYVDLNHPNTYGQSAIKNVAADTATSSFYVNSDLQSNILTEGAITGGTVTNLNNTIGSNPWFYSSYNGVTPTWVEKMNALNNLLYALPKKNRIVKYIEDKIIELLREV